MNKVFAKITYVKFSTEDPAVYGLILRFKYDTRKFIRYFKYCLDLTTISNKDEAKEWVDKSIEQIKLRADVKNIEDIKGMSVELGLNENQIVYFEFKQPTKTDLYGEAV